MISQTNTMLYGAGDSAELNHNYYRWLQSALNSAVGEHRWEDAFKLLPCLILHRCYNVSSDFLWRVSFYTE